MLDEINNLLLETLDYRNTNNRPLKQLIIDDGFELLHNTCIAHSPTLKVRDSKNRFDTKVMTELFVSDIKNRVEGIS